MKTCIITGATGGIGRAVAIELSNSGYYSNIVIIGRREEELEITEKTMNSQVNIEKIKFDLENLEEIPHLVDLIESKFGNIDTLCNIAGYTDPQPLLQTSNTNLYKTFVINVFSPIILIREVARIMKSNSGGGKVLNVSSTSGSTPRPGWLSYAASKAALNSVSMTLSEELAEYNIKVYNVSPGRCATDLRKKLAPNEDPSTIMQPADVAKVIRNLLTSEVQVLDGQNIVVRKR